MKVVDDDSASIEENIKKLKSVTLIKDKARFIGKKTLTAGGKEITADRIVIAAGTRPSLPPIKGLKNVPYMTSDEVLRLKELPKKLVIIGGGYIACEFAHFFGSVGSKITILQRNTKLLPDEDEDIYKKFTEIFSKRYDVKLGFAVSKVEKTSKGGVRVYSKDGTSVEGTHLLIATGRSPNTDQLDVAKGEIKTNPQGYVAVNDYFETNVEGVYAFGDIIGRYLFKHAANLEAEYLIRNLFAPDPKLKTPADYTAMPHAVFSSPQIAGVGVIEQELKEKGTEYLSVHYHYSDTGMGAAMMEEDGFVKFLADYDGKILGCHIIGPEASTLIHEVLVAMRIGKGSVEDILNTIHIHPSLSEVVERAAGKV
jgi:dihydrolipoamide dehydrogenase